jgi:hypothetical protein
VRVAVITGAGNEAFAPLFRERLIFNGKTAIENQNDPGCNQCFAQIDATKRTSAQVVDDLIAFAPNIIIPLTDTSWGAATMPLLESKLTGVQSTRPVYLHPVLRDEDAGYRALNVADPLVRARFVGLRPDRDDAVVAGFNDRFKTRTGVISGKAGGTPSLNAGRTYENMLLALYAAYAAGRGERQGEFTGAELAAAVKDVTTAGSTVVAPGPLSMLDAILGLNKLVTMAPKQTFGQIDFNGVYTQFDFGEDRAVSNRFQVFCLTSFGQYASNGRAIKNGKTFEGGVSGLCK